MNEETRQGFIFTAKVERPTEVDAIVSLFLEGNDEPIDQITLSLFDAMANDPVAVDRAFQKWVGGGLFNYVIEDPALLNALTIDQREIKEGIPWYRKTFRFLRAAGSTTSFILTSDKSDLPERERRMLELGEETVLQEEAKAREAEGLQRKEELGRKRELRGQYEQIITRLAKSALNKKSTGIDDVRTLSEVGLLEPTTTFRNSLCPREALIFWYDFVEEGVRYVGYVGFDHGLQLVSIDERLPQPNQVYLG